MEKLKDDKHISVLDGWRGVSIVLVLLAHLMPLPGAKFMASLSGVLNGVAPGRIQIDASKWNFNDATGIFGMVIFFNLSGFLITNFLLTKNATTASFLIRRFFRIIPLVWLYIVIVFAILQPSIQTWFANLFFYANLPPKQLVPFHDHLWSICAEVQFYIGIAALFFFFNRKGLLFLPLLAVFFTALRLYNHAFSSSITYFRIDEILAGCTLSLLLKGQLGNLGRMVISFLHKIPQIPLLLLLYASSFPQSEALNYFRPYISAVLIGSTICAPETSLSKFLGRKTLQYLASISYALYVIHLGLTETWLGQGNLTEKYLKRPLLLVTLFVMAHVSTFYYEKRWTEFGRRLSRNHVRTPGQTTPSTP